ncbi:hypothetical protein X802_09800 [Thermococcus guaymasensis DSM 11113]|uniref:Uncharacterized protein n=1 Tax=Thermococcus guaymasensis DSM 11113 TaxID=1432656 RepID=A0A0X1KMB9_9EURY|nr:hypothetical protein [Thermococcus guaymasensis]AJC72407.1 hypothetical protein X802_09800 [Thermococcus guaymasensis DSM 11113]
MKRALVTLTPSESKRLIAKAVVAMPEVQHALRRGFVYIATGTTAAYVAEEILGEKIEKEKWTVGTISKGRTCVTAKKTWPKHLVLYKGKPFEGEPVEALREMGPEDVFIKGANAIDINWNVAVFAAAPDGGTIGRTFGWTITKGVFTITPISLEKFVPTPVEESAKLTGIYSFDWGTGLYAAIVPIPHAHPVTEVEAYRILAGVEAIPIAAGGAGGAEGSVTLVLEGEDEDMEKAREITKAVKGEPPLKPYTEDCSICPFAKICGVGSGAF